MSQLELISVHLPKTGGSSLFEALQRHYGDALHHDGSHDPGNPAHNIYEPPLIPASARAVHGHFRADRYARYANAFRITFLRDPIEKFISGYFYWLTLPPHDNPLHDQLLRERPSILDYAASYAGNSFHAYFGDMDLSRLDYVGFLDRREIDYRVLSRILGLPIEIDIHANRTELPPDLKSERQAIEADHRILSRLKILFADDYAFYNDSREQWT